MRGGGGAQSRRDSLRRRTDARPAARRHRRHSAERAHALRRGAVCARSLFRRRRAGAPRRAADRRRVAAGPRRPLNRTAREDLLRGAMHAGHALGLAGLALAHAMAQAIGGAYGPPHGAMNALCLPPALAFNAEFVPQAVERFGAAIGGDAVERSRELARLGGFERLRDFGIPEEACPACRRRRPARRKPGESTPCEPRRDPGVVPLDLLD